MSYISSASTKNTTASFPHRRESSQFNKPRSGQNLVAPLRKNYLFHWIPACAGMTEIEVQDD
jgi:hypothetical protein